jgi:hypothetical protein
MQEHSVEVVKGKHQGDPASVFSSRSETSIEFSIMSMQDPTELPIDMASASLARAASCRRKSMTVFSTDHLTWESAFFCVKPSPLSKESNYAQLRKLYSSMSIVITLWTFDLSWVVTKHIASYKPFLCHPNLLQKLHI